MNFGRIISSFAAGLLIFVAILFAENARFEFKNNIKNPFKSAQDIQQVDFEALGDSEPTAIFSTDGEFFRFYPGSNVDFSEGNREIIDGSLFVTTQFVRDEETQRAKKSFKGPFKPSGFNPGVGQLKVGKFFVSMPNSSVFIDRDIKRKQTKIYAVNHSVELFFENATTPFILPSNMLIDIHDDLVSEKTGKLYYTKLKKELKMQSFLLNLASSKDENAKGATNETKISKSIKAKNSLHYEIRDFAQKIPKTWIWFESDGVMGAFVGIIKTIQASVAIGYPETKLKQYRFDQLVKPFIFANTAVKVTDTELATEYLNNFGEEFEKTLWFKLLLEEEIEAEWTTFEHAHKSWLRNIFPDDPAQVFVKFWNKNDTTNSFADIESIFSAIELLISNQHYQEAIVRLTEIRTDVKSLTVTEADQARVTKFRRLLFEMLKERSFFQRNEVFELYGYLIAKEMGVYKGEKQEEIALESAQNIMFFLKDFIGPSDKAEISSTLIEVFDLLNVAEITRSRGRAIFTSEELDLIETINYVGSTGLTEDLMKALEEKRRKDEENRKKQEDRITGGEVEAPVGSRILTASQLVAYLEDVNIKTKGIKVYKSSTGYRFSETLYGRLPVSGTFSTATQKFTILTVGSESEQNLIRSRVQGFLSLVQNQSTKDTTGPSNSGKNLPPLKTQEAVLARDNVRTYFENINIAIEMSDIIPLDFDYKMFKINNSVYKNESRLSFIYLDKDDTVESIVLQTGWIQQELPRIKIQRKELPREIDRLLEVLSKNRK